MLFSKPTSSAAKPTHSWTAYPTPHLRECLEYPLAITILPRRVIDSIASALGIKKYSNDLSELPLIKVDSVPIIKATVASSDAIGMGLLPMVERSILSPF